MFRILGVLLVTTLFKFSSFAAPVSDCNDIIEELQAMKKAQSTIQSSLVSNHEMFATSLDSYSEALSATMGRAHKTVSENMLQSAESFRTRGLKAQKMSVKLDQATGELIQKISKCLK